MNARTTPAANQNRNYSHFQLETQNRNANERHGNTEYKKSITIKR